jgi:hypothetical protein
MQSKDMIRSVSKIMAELRDVACFTMHPNGYSGTYYKSLDSPLGKCTTLTELWMVCSELFKTRAVAFAGMVGALNFLHKRPIWYILPYSGHNGAVTISN